MEREIVIFRHCGVRVTPRVFPQGGNYASRRRRIVVTIRQDIVRIFRDAENSRMRAGENTRKTQRTILHLAVIVGRDFPHELPKLCKYRGN